MRKTIMPLTLGLLLASFFVSSDLDAQSTKTKSSLDQTWFTYFNQTRFSKHWGVWADLQLYTKKMDALPLATFEPRLGLIYYLKDDARIDAGWAYVNSYPAEGHLNISVPENRLWQQFQWFTPYRRIKLMEWIRLEERWVRKVKNDDSLGIGSNFSYRIRYMIFTTVPLAQKGPWSKWAFVAGDEIYINFGKAIVNNYFDQNRLYLGISYKTTPHDNVQIGYTNLFQQLSGGNKYKEINALKFSYFHNLDLRKKTK